MAKAQRTLNDWLGDIVEWGDRMARYVEGMDEAAFAVDLKTQDAVIRCLECIGEASRQIIAAGDPQRFRDVAFVEAYWMRNRLAHGYYDVNPERVWATATDAAPDLVRQARVMLDELSE